MGNIKEKTKRFLIAAAAVLFWLVVWHIAAFRLDSNIILVSPVDAAKRLWELLGVKKFWKSVLFSSERILLGFAIGLASGTVIALASWKIKPIRALFAPLILTLKSIPVASFTILALIWVGSKNLSVLVSVLICVPIVCANMLEGLDALDPKLKEMSRVFKIPPVKRFVGVYLSQLLPYFRSACKLGIGLSWKSGIAAEVIGIPTGSIGENLYQSKIYLETADLFAWTIVVILLSLICEKAFLLLLKLLQKRVERF